MRISEKKVAAQLMQIFQAILQFQKTGQLRELPGFLTVLSTRVLSSRWQQMKIATMDIVQNHHVLFYSFYMYILLVEQRYETPPLA
jgi:hypothetical protein